MKSEERRAAPTSRCLYDYWLVIRGERVAPRRSDIDPSDIVPVLPYLGILDVEPAPRRYRGRLAGTRFVIRYERLHLPLAHEGERVDMLLGAAVRLAQDKPIPGDWLDK